MLGYRFSEFVPQEGGKPNFEQLLSMFMQLLVYTSGDVAEALQWLNQLDRQYGLTDDEYGMGDFLRELQEKGYIDEEKPNSGVFQLTAKSEQSIRRRSLEEIFGKLKKTKPGNHHSPLAGLGDEPTTDRRDFQFGDSVEHIAMTDSLRNAQINHGLGDFHLTEDDLEVVETEYKTQTSTVLMIDISHSMILYGEDRITPAKKVAMALSELILTRYPKDSLDVLLFGDEAWQVEVKDLPFISVGPYHTNTKAGLALARQILKRKKNQNKQIFMITDGKPSAINEGAKIYKNSFGLDRKIVNKTLDEAVMCRKDKITITTFMVTSDPYLQGFVNELTQANQGRAYFSGLDNLGEYMFVDYIKNRRKKLR